jgi:hypothetical protein
MNLDYFNGRAIESVTEENDEGATWVINLEDDGTIYVFDPSYAMPTGFLEGSRLTRTLMDNLSTTIYFGVDGNPFATCINVHPDKYAVKDAIFTKGELVYPQRSAMEKSAAMEEYEARFAERGAGDVEDDDGA